jgi:hypothetical protein
MVWDHWILYNVPPDAGGLEEAIPPDRLPPRCGEGINSWGRTGYGGPCPPVGRHRYFHSIYALDCVLPNLETPDKNRLLLAMEGHILAHCALVGTYASQA